LRRTAGWPALCRQPWSLQPGGPLVGGPSLRRAAARMGAGAEIDSGMTAFSVCAALTLGKWHYEYCCFSCRCCCCFYLCSYCCRYYLLLRLLLPLPLMPPLLLLLVLLLCTVVGMGSGFVLWARSRVWARANSMLFTSALCAAPRECAVDGGGLHAHY
jgi:hypothetical protein